MRQKFVHPLALAVLCLLIGVSAASAQTSNFSYQGRLSEAGAPANGTYDLKFRLYDSGGNPQGSPDTVTLDSPGVQVTNGVFTVQLDFGAGAFDGGARLLEISVRPHSAAPDAPAYTSLTPRQPITSTPYAIRSSKAASADTAVTATTATNFSGSLSGDVTGTQGATTVSSVGGQAASNVASGAAAANAATEINTAGAIVKRDVSGNFAAGTVTAALNDNAATATSAASATNFSGSLSGDVTGTQGATVVSAVGGQSAANVASGVSAANAATSADTANAIVSRDASGNFSAGTITASLNGNASTATTATTATNATSATTAATADAVSASAGDSVVMAINASSSTVNAAPALNARDAERDEHLQRLQHLQHEPDLQRGPLGKRPTHHRRRHADGVDRRRQQELRRFELRPVPAEHYAER